ncbi:hypothetical protein [Rhodococcus opacus]|uniref:hypothetical protein n=1 Tax=Rhodococcus opacus TaxID=37919 RepID=UPI000A478632|nr:hypothetical protein [Rhodococcus opacus]
MPKFDVSTNARAQDALLEKLENPRHRRIVENYRRHALLEVGGDYERIFAPEMTVEVPRYKIVWGASAGEEIVGEDVKEMYRQMAEVGANVIVVTDEEIAVCDDGFFSRADMTQFAPGVAVRELGYEVDDDSAWYALTFYVVAFWPYDEQCRMIGETGAAIGPPRIEKIAAEDVVTAEQARAALLPQVRPLTPFESMVVG